MTREWYHGGVLAKDVKPYRCRLCRRKTSQTLRTMHEDRICPWCAVDLGRRICEGLDAGPSGNFFYSREEEAEYNMRRNPSRIPPATRAAVFARDGKVCGHCGSTERPVLDHRLPASRGGLPVESNLWVLCHECNTSKKAKTVEEWLAVGGRINRHLGRAA